MKSAEEIAQLAYTEKINRGPLHARRVRVRDLYGGDIAVPLPELTNNEEAAIANLLRLGLDGTAQRIASNTPDVRWPAVRDGFKTHEDTSRLKHQVSMGWWEQSSMELIDLRRARLLTGYGESPVSIRWDRKKMIPFWHVADPLNTYCAAPTRMDDMRPMWTLTCMTRPRGWLQKYYIDAWASISGDDKDPKTPIELVLYEDEYESVLIAVGKKDEYDSTYYGGQRAVTLERIENRIGCNTSVVPGRIGLGDDRFGQFDGMIPKYVRQARLDALQTIAIEEGIFPKTWLVARGQEVPKIITVAEPKKGIPGKVSGGDIITIAQNPGYKTDSALANLERDQRIEGGIPANWGGESPSGARGARMADVVEGGAIDFGIAENHKILARSKQAELEIAAEMAKAYAGNVSISLYVSTKGVEGAVTYKASELFASTRVTVEYPFAGADEPQRVAIVGAKLSNKLISRQTAREQDPQVKNAELEKDRTTFEALEDAVLTGYQTMAASALDAPGALEQVLRIGELVRTNKMELIEAGIQASKEAKEAQAAQAPPAPPGMAAAPETMPGLGTPSAPQPAAPPGPPDLAALASRLGGAVGPGVAA